MGFRFYHSRNALVWHLVTCAFILWTCYCVVLVLHLLCSALLFLSYLIIVQVHHDHNKLMCSTFYLISHHVSEFFLWCAFVQSSSRCCNIWDFSLCVLNQTALSKEVCTAIQNQAISAVWVKCLLCFKLDLDFDVIDVQ